MNKILTRNKAPKNKTVSLSDSEIKHFTKELLTDVSSEYKKDDFVNRIINGNIFDWLNKLPDNFIDLLFIDPPYNLYKKYNKLKFKSMKEENYEAWFDSWLNPLVKKIKNTASIYVCCDWKSSNAIYNVIKKYFVVRNRITWEREKGRGSKNNWKNCSEDIWFCTLSNNYTFNVDAIKIRRKVLAPYKDKNGKPKDWKEEAGLNYRLTFPSNIWTDISVPFWSMPENTEHPTQKPEKLLAKLILASSNPGDMIFDPFLGSGTAAVTAKKLNRNFCGVELDNYFCCLALKRLQLAESDKTIQGYSDGIFWERNSFNLQKK